SLTSLTRILRRVVVSGSEGPLTSWLGRGGLIGMLVGMILTVAVQSSSITTSLLIPLIGAGLVPLEGAFAVTLGANLGTTVTALLASLAGNSAAVTVALVHLMFNVSGIALIYPLAPVRRIPIRFARLLALRTVRNRAWAIVYLMGVFFALPLVFVLLDRWFG
ncbi:hypothetical protein GF314_01205, partial [bacterium]|nr:hypothetical protein [bacterium]